MNAIVVGLIGAAMAAVSVVGGVQTYNAATIDKDSVPKIVNGNSVTYADE